MDDPQPVNDPEKPMTPSDSPEANTLSQHVHRGLKSYEQQNLQAALQEFDAALAIHPEDPGARLMRGIILRDLEQDDDAEKIFHSLVEDADVAGQALTNLGLLARRREDFTSCEEYLRAAIAKNFQFAPAHFNLAVLLLEQGNLREGFREYEWRWHTRNFTRFPGVQPRWDGRPLDGTLLVHTEQGTEDTVQFCRYLPRLRQSCRRLILVCAERMGALFAAPEWADQVCFPGEIAADSFDAYLPLLSAPLVFQTDLDSIPAEIPYIRPQGSQFALGDSPVPQSRLRVAVAWGQGPADVADGNRYCTLAAFAPLFQVPEVAFYSLQQGAPSEEASHVALSTPSLRNVADLPDDLGNMASLLSQFDLLVSTDTSLAHLAGALGIPTWNLLSRRCHWRWMRDREDSPWYPTMRLFRQNVLHGWPELVRHVAGELSAAVSDPGRLTLSKSR